ncbi:MAG: flavodoxin domain-containing protein [Treponemataceae bacterium]
MSNVEIVYWSGTGNYWQMAEAIKTGASDAGATVSVFTASEFDEGKMDEFDSVAFGCSAMGNEELEEAEFTPMFEACKSKLKEKK